MMYAQDNGETYPNQGWHSPGYAIQADWRYLMQPYLKNAGVFACPSNRFTDEVWYTQAYYGGSVPADQQVWLPMCYGVNQQIIPKDGKPIITLAQAKKPVQYGDDRRKQIGPR